MIIFYQVFAEFWSLIIICKSLSGPWDRHLHTAKAPGVPDRIPNTNLVISSFYRLAIYIPIYEIQ